MAKETANTVILIPALDPPEEFIEYTRELQKNGFRDIIVVNDGSRDHRIFDELKQNGCIILEHEKNLGKGQALKNGFQYYKDHFDWNHYCDFCRVENGIIHVAIYTIG
ncbi:MAG: glycosyltransferase [Eubacteriales bacterium]|nr:glycosyltransferase [Eubacteriales bacterium]